MPIVTSWRRIPHMKDPNLERLHALLLTGAASPLGHECLGFLAHKKQQLNDPQWVADNKAGFEAYNERIEEHGLFSDGRRGF